MKMNKVPTLAVHAIDAFPRRYDNRLTIYDPSPDVYTIHTGNAKLYDCGVNSITLQWLDGENKGRYILYTLNGHAYDVTRYVERDYQRNDPSYSKAIKRNQRFDWLNGRLLINGEYWQVDRIENASIANGFHNVKRSDEKHVVDIVKRICGEYIPLSLLYIHYRIGYVNEYLVITRGNVAYILSRTRIARRIHFANGAAYVHNGYLVHVRSEFFNSADITRLYDINGRQYLHPVMFNQGPEHMYRRFLITEGVMRLLNRIDRLENIRQKL